MKTYAEENGESVFDWNAFLDRAIKGHVTPQERRLAADMASSWVTCACGNQCSVIKRRSDGEPMDTVLSNLGYEFYEEMTRGFYRDAKKILNKIERRSAKLIQKHYAH